MLRGLGKLTSAFRSKLNPSALVARTRTFTPPVSPPQQTVKHPPQTKRTDLAGVGPKQFRRMLTTQALLNPLNAIQAPKKRVTSPTYVSPYEIDCPLDFVVVHNRSHNARISTVTQLRDAWSSNRNKKKLKFIEVVQEGREPVLNPYATVRIKAKDWPSFENFKAQFDKLLLRDPVLRQSFQAGNVGFYSAWSAQAEKAEWAAAIQEAGFLWGGADPETMKGLAKIAYKELCQELGLPTAKFVTVPPPKDTMGKEEAFKLMALEFLETYQNTPGLAGEPVFIKHEQGGGGRGSKKVAEVNYENVLEAIRKVVNETGGDLHGVYAEQSLDFRGAQLFQLELECDSYTLAPGSRLVRFNPENQKVLEVGFTDTAILKHLPKDIYDACRAASKAIFKASGYNNRGTNEILIVKDKDGKWWIYMLELNKRIQVEHLARALLYLLMGFPNNVPAEQFMRAMGYPPPQDSDYQEVGHAIAGHVRLLSCDITPKGSVYHGGVEIDGAMHPQDVDVQYVPGPVNLDADPQIGRAIIYAKNWEEFCDKLLKFSQEFQFYGPKTEASTYFDFFRKFASDPRVRADTLGCNQTFEVLGNSPVEKGEPQKMAEALSHTVVPLVTHGYRPGEGVKDQPYPTLAQIKEFVDFMEKLGYEKVPETPYSRFVKHSDYKRYIKELKDLLADHGGGTISVIRDVQQSSADQESALIQAASAKIAEIFFAGSGIGVGFEEGGAQFQAGLMRQFDWMAVLLSACLSNLPAHALTRSKWLWGLAVKSPQKQAFVFNTVAAEIAQLYGLPLERPSFLPWFPYNFHAGNHPEQDQTTREMLRANLGAIPNWAWDPRYTQEQFRGWVKRQIDLFEEEGKPLSQIRIKNSGQGPMWNADVIVAMVQIIRQMFRERGLEEPIIMVHNHEFDGSAGDIAAEAIIRCQQLGYPFLIVDSAPPATSHNSNLVLSRAFTMSAEERERLALYNRGSLLAIDLTRRFNNQSISRFVQDPNSEMAGGTNSSDIADAVKMGIPLHEISQAIALARKLTGLGTAVTPYSEWIKQVGFAIWKNEAIQPKTVAAATEYINNGGKLAIAVPILEGLEEWLTLLPQPEVMRKLLANHDMAPGRKKDAKPAEPPLDVEADRATLQAKLPRTRVTNRVLSTVYAFDKIGQAFLERRDRGALADGPRDMTVMMESPEFAHSQVKKVGDTFLLYGRKFTIHSIQPLPESGQINLTILRNSDNRLFRLTGIDPNKVGDAIVKKLRLVQDKKREVGTPMAGSLVGLFVKPGDSVKKGQVLATMEAMKMEHTIKADRDGVVESVRELDEKNKIVQGDEVLVTFKP